MLRLIARILLFILWVSLWYVIGFALGVFISNKLDAWRNRRPAFRA